MSGFSSAFSSDAFDAGIITPTGIGSGAIELGGGSYDHWLEGAGKIELGGLALDIVPTGVASDALLLGGIGEVKTDADYRYDQYWSNCNIAMRFNGVVGTAEFIDEKGHAVTHSTQPVLSSNWFDSSPTSLYIEPGQNVTFTELGLINFGTGDFTLAFSFSADFYYGATTLASVLDSLGNGFNIERTYDNIGVVGQPYSGWSVYGEIPAPSTTAKVMITRQAGTFRIFIDGNLVTTTSFGASPKVIGAADATVRIGGGFSGYIDDFYVVTGVALEIASYAPTQIFNIPVEASASGKLQLSGSGAGGYYPYVAGFGNNSVSLSGAGAGDVAPNGFAANQLSLNGAASGGAGYGAAASGAILLSGASSAIFKYLAEGVGGVVLNGAGFGLTGFSGSGVGQVVLAGRSDGSLSRGVVGFGAGQLALFGGGVSHGPAAEYDGFPLEDQVFVKSQTESYVRFI